MKRVNDFEFYQLASVLHPLRDLQDGVQLKDCWYMLFQAQTWLEYLLRDELIPLVIAKPTGLLLHKALLDLVNKYRHGVSDPPALSTRQLDFSELFPVRSKIREFETILSAELQSMATYFVSQKLAYETRLLIEEAERILPSNIVGSLKDDTIDEIRQAGRCVAFDIPTAAAFHIIRATESVIREYYGKIMGTLPKVKMRNWGAYIRNLRGAEDVNEGVLAILDHIRTTYRNPILHPEVTLSTDQSHVILSLCTGAITQMVLAMQNLDKKASSSTELALARSVDATFMDLGDLEKSE